MIDLQIFDSPVVFDSTKILILKQFTTAMGSPRGQYRLCLIVQRY